MANGVLRSQAEYYGDDIKYTGNVGSETNMYVIEDVYDLCAAVGQTYYYVLVDDIDFNDHDVYRYGVDGLIFGGGGNICYLRGNNHKIRNLIIKHSTTEGIFNAASVSDVIFENLIVISSTVSHLFCSYRSIDITNVRIGGYMFNSASSVILYGNNINFIDCSFNLKGFTTDGVCGYAGKSSRSFTRCHINCDITTECSDCINFDYCDVYDSCITGKIKQTGKNFASGNRNRYVANGIFYNSYFAVGATCETEGFDGYIAPYLIANSVSFMDKELVLHIEEGTISNFYYLTTEQATDPDYLLSINFPVVAV